MKPWKFWAVFSGGVLAVVLAILSTLLTPAWASTTASADGYFTERLIITNGDQATHYIPTAAANCTVYGTWDGATVSMETEVPGTAGEERNVGVEAFLGATADVEFTQVQVGSGRYRLTVSGAGAGTSLTFHCRW